MRFVKKYEAFLSAEPAVKPSKPKVEPKPGERPKAPSIMPGEQQSPVPAPAKAMKTATAEDVAQRFIELINQSGDDIKKYVEIK